MIGDAQVSGDITAVAPCTWPKLIASMALPDGKAQVVQPYFRFLSQRRARHRTQPAISLR